MDLETVIRALSGILFVVGILAIPALYWFFGRGADEQEQSKARRENERGEREGQSEEHGSSQED